MRSLWWLPLLLAVEPPVAEPVVEPVAEPVVDAATAEAGEVVLERAVLALAEGRFDDAIAIATPAISRYPALASSFRAVLEVAVDQDGRAPTAPRVVGWQDPYAYEPRYPPSYRPVPSARADGAGAHAGVDLGFPTGVRGELTFGKPGVHAVGLRLGANLLEYGGLYVVGDTTAYVDFAGRKGGNWQTEVTTGLVWYYGSPYFQVGLAAQYDPPTPLLVNLGARITVVGVAPDVSVGFMW